MSGKYKKALQWMIVVGMLALPFAVVLAVLGIWCIVVCYAAVMIGWSLYLSLLWRCPYCGHFLPGYRNLMQLHDGCCPHCGMNVPESERDIDQSWFTKDDV